MQNQANRKQSHLEESIALLIHTQAAFVSQIAESNKEMVELKRQTEKSLEAIRKDFVTIMAMLSRHERILSELPETIRQKIGFQPS